MTNISARSVLLADRASASRRWDMHDPSRTATTDQSETNAVMMTVEHPPSGERERARAPDAPEQTPASGFSSQGMGALELASYVSEWRASYRFRRRTAEIAAERERQKTLKSLEAEARKAAAKAMREKGLAPPASGKSAFSEGRRSVENVPYRTIEEEFTLPTPRYSSNIHPTTAGKVAARLMLARLFDSRPSLVEAIRSDAPVVIIDIPDPELVGRVGAIWHDVLFEHSHNLMNVAGEGGPRENYDAVYLIVQTLPAAKDRSRAETAALSALSLALPFIALSPLGVTHLPEAVLKATTNRIEFPRLDPITVVRTIRIITGRRCREEVDAELAAKITIADLIVAVRFDRSPAQCLAELRRLASLKDSKKKSRDLALSEIHGLGEARTWAESTIADIAAWKRGEISWDAISSAIAIAGPPGTGKTLFAKAFASDTGLNLIASSLAKWQSSGEAHLGHLLRAMRADFDAARTQAPSVLFIDEIDSFPDRAGVTHAHRDYVIEVVNALLEQIDGITGREGVILIGASNDISRCDPALLRAGRFDRIVKVGLPNIDELEQMFRVRLGSALCTEDIRPIAELAIGMTGADVERIVKDAKRAARQTARDITLHDLRQALVPDDDRPPELRWRTCVHEASHIVVDVIHFGAEHVFATTAPIGGRAGASIRSRLEWPTGTHEYYRKRLEVVLAGRVGEEILLGAASHGAGGVAGSDLDIATTLAADMVASLGLVGPKSLTYFGPRGSGRDFLFFGEIREAVADQLAAAAKSCRALLEANQDVLEAVALRLSESGRIDGDEVSELIARSVK